MKKTTKSKIKRNTKNRAKKPANPLYVKLINFLATSCYVGYIPKMPGTCGSLFAVALFWLIFRHFDIVYFFWFIPLFFAVGVFVSGEYDRLHRTKDAEEIVIDEVIGQSIALLPVVMIFYMLNPEEVALLNVEFVLSTLISFIFFRFFDIVKPLGVYQLQKLPAGWGVVLDDVLAGIYAYICWYLVFFLLGLFL